jgi:Polyketide cyclase / dehydrase and lipid transport
LRRPFICQRGGDRETAVQIDLARSVAATPALIFATIADITSWPQIISSVIGIELLTPGPIRLRLDRVRFGVTTSEELEVSTMDRPHRLRLVGEDRGMRYELDHLVDAVFGAGSRLMLVFRTRTSTSTGRALADFTRTFMEVKLRDELEQDLADLAAAIEARASDLPAAV